MNYMQYYEQCRYPNRSPKVPIDQFQFLTLPFKLDVSGVHDSLFKDVESITPEEWIVKINYKKEFLPTVKFLYEQIAEPLDEIFCCPVFIETFGIYRTVPYHTRTTSTIYHYDNTPQTMLRVLIYLDDVASDDDGPIEFCKGLIKEPTRQGPQHWFPPPNNSRLSDLEVAPYEKVKVYGGPGTTTIFYPSCVHRANPPGNGRHRDVVNFIVRPTHDPSHLYKYIKGFEKHGSPLQNPLERFPCSE